MKKLILLFLLSLMTIIWGCNRDASVVAPEPYSIVVDPTEYSFSASSSVIPYQKEFKITVSVYDEKNNIKQGQELFFFCHMCNTGVVELYDDNGNFIDVSQGSVHGVTGDGGYFYLWVKYFVGGYLRYDTDIQITSGPNENSVSLSVNNDY